MLKRFLLIFAMTFLPLATTAEDVPAADVTPNPAAVTATPDPTAAQGSAADMSGLGPQTNTSAGASNADAGSLQPAGVSPLQSTSSDSTGLTAPNANTLQAPLTPGEVLKVLDTEGDGQPHNLSDQGMNELELWGIWTIIVGLIASAGYVAYRRFRKPRPLADTP